MGERQSLNELGCSQLLTHHQVLLLQNFTFIFSDDLVVLLFRLDDWWLSWTVSILVAVSLKKMTGQQTEIIVLSLFLRPLGDPKFFLLRAE